jgi:transcriptional regulator with XRE-family HTH domain
MPSAAPDLVDPLARDELRRLGASMRAQRKSMRLAAESVARAANVSRQTLHRIECGEPSVTMGAYVNAMRTLGLSLTVVERVHLEGTRGDGPVDEDSAGIKLDAYPQLRQLAWHRDGGTVTEDEAFALYERHWRHLDRDGLSPAEQALITRLTERQGKGALLV